MGSNIAFGIVTGFIFICLIVLFCVLLVKLYINKIKNYTKVIYQKDIDFQKSLNTAIIETQEQVLNNISGDLHDDAGQQLTYINFQIENLKLDVPELAEVLQPLSQSVSNLSDSIRGISHSLNNQLITQQDLLKAITTEVERLQKNAHVTIQLRLKDTVKKTFTVNEKIVIYRIFQEIINNCFKHAKACHIEIHIMTSPFFVMRITDDGKGFNYEDIRNNAISLGLNNMKNRAEIIDYELSIQSELGKGTTITLSEKQ